MFNINTKALTGPGGTVYTVASQTAKGVVGYANIGAGSFRVRVEPFVCGSFAALVGYKQPTPGNNRFSTIVSESNLARTVVNSVKALNNVVVAPPAPPKPTTAEVVAKALKAAGL